MEFFKIFIDFGNRFYKIQIVIGHEVQFASISGSKVRSIPEEDSLRPKVMIHPGLLQAIISCIPLFLRLEAYGFVTQ